jgi:hypothetical protein
MISAFRSKYLKLFTGLHLPVSERKPEFTVKDGGVILTVHQIMDHEIVGVDLG